jgi:NADH dehydrogenase FAD-containing subunit
MLQDDVHVKLIETRDHILGAFDRHISEYADKHFAREGIEVRLMVGHCSPALCSQLAMFCAEW